MEGQAPLDKDTRALHALGYAQELSRRMSGFSNFAISFTIISILSGTLTLYGTGMNYGGPVEEAYGWPLVSVFVIIVGLGMAEIASKYPTAGGLYYWASKMGGPVWGWFTGWFNLIGQIAITAGIDYGAAVFADALLQPAVVGHIQGDPARDHLRLRLILALHALMNIFSVKLRRAPERRLGVVARDRRRRDRRLPDLQADHHQSFGDRVRPHGQQQRLLAQLAVVRAAPRLAAGAVHLHGLRRVGAHERGDARRVALGGARRDHVDRRLGGLRLHPRARRDVRDPGPQDDGGPAASRSSRCSSTRSGRRPPR